MKPKDCVFLQLIQTAGNNTAEFIDVGANEENQTEHLEARKALIFLEASLRKIINKLNFILVKEMKDYEICIRRNLKILLEIKQQKVKFRQIKEELDKIEGSVGWFGGKIPKKAKQTGAGGLKTKIPL